MFVLLRALYISGVWNLGWIISGLPGLQGFQRCGIFKANNTRMVLRKQGHLVPLQTGRVALWRAGAMKPVDITYFCSVESRNAVLLGPQRLVSLGALTPIWWWWNLPWRRWRGLVLKWLCTWDYMNIRCNHKDTFRPSQNWPHTPLQWICSSYMVHMWHEPGKFAFFWQCSLIVTTSHESKVHTFTVPGVVLCSYNRQGPKILQNLTW